MSRPALPRFDAAALGDVAKQLGLRSVILFGSQATGSPPPHDESDLDVALAFLPSKRRLGLAECHRELDPLFAHESLDLVVLADADPLFRWEIMRDAVLLWGDPLDFLELRAFAYRDFVDSADLRALEGILFEKKLNFIRARLGHAAA